MRTEVIVIESVAFKQLEARLENMEKLFLEAVGELKKLKDNRLMSVKEVCAYTGFSIDWVNKHKEDIGYSQIGSKDLRFYKEDIDKYFLKNRIKKK